MFYQSSKQEISHPTGWTQALVPFCSMFCSIKLYAVNLILFQVINCIWKNPNAPVVYLACDLLGQEEILVEVSKTFGSKIYVDKTNNSECFFAVSLTASEILSDDASSRFHVCSWLLKQLLDILVCSGYLTFVSMNVYDVYCFADLFIHDSFVRWLKDFQDCMKEQMRNSVRHELIFSQSLFLFGPLCSGMQELNVWR